MKGQHCGSGKQKMSKGMGEEKKGWAVGKF